ncbi:MAG: DNA mismatch repair protein MutS [Dethiosulfatibacter sp.]|nr:DNA mismatch repair protein MutS [Dethiosulfatibacter sp.]
MESFIDKNSQDKIGINTLLNKIIPLSPYGTAKKREMPIYKPGHEDLLKMEYNLMAYLDNYYLDRDVISMLNHVKDITESVKRAESGEVLTAVELFEIKNFVLHTMRVYKTFRDNKFYDDIRIERMMDVIELLDPAGEKLNTFYIYDEYSAKLKQIRTEKMQVSHLIKKIKKEIKDEIQVSYNVKLSLKGDIYLNKSEEDLIRMMDEDKRLYCSDQTISQIVYSIKNTDELYRLDVQINNLKAREEDEEYEVLKYLSKEVGIRSGKFRNNFSAVGKIDLILAKLRQAKTTDSRPPTIIKEHRVEIVNGRHLKTEEVLTKKNKSYTAVSIKLDRPATSITGANMGGKTVTLKMIGQIACATALGLYVPAEECTIGLSGKIFVSIGDEQSVEKGLSTFGAEIQNLTEAFKNVNDRCLILIDELAGGTNPVEGFAITKSIVGYLSDKNSISVITTHFDKAAGQEVQKLQVAGLKKIDLKKLEQELLENPGKGMDIITDNMDYHLIPAEEYDEVPKDAINIAELMGMQKEIVDQAKKYIEGK